MLLLTNHIGYRSAGPKKAVLQAEEGLDAGAFSVIEAESGRSAFSGQAVYVGPVASWRTGSYWRLDFSPLRGEGRFRIELATSEGILRSADFELRERLIEMRMISGVGYYFKAQRDTGEWLARDRGIDFERPRAGRDERSAATREGGLLDLHGGWFDATGDYGIHLSHLSHASFFNPQQAAFSAYAFFRVFELLEDSGGEQYSMISRRLLDEGTWGADFLMRMRSPSGSFFRSIGREGAFDIVSHKRRIELEYRGSSSQFGEASTAAEETVTDRSYEVSFRSGGGFAIAALASASRHYYPGAAFSRDEYIRAAKAAYACLERDNELYANDGRWNLLDEYCALAALVELYRATAESGYLLEARGMAARMTGRLVDAGEGRAYWEAAPGRPFHHASDAGMPVFVLLSYAGIEKDPSRAASARGACEKAMRFELAVTREVANPFGYARFLFRDEDDGSIKRRFFFPHNSRPKPWWQGENARLASLACSATLLASEVAEESLAMELARYATDQLDWIMGLNPFDACMIEGYGRNNIQYSFNGRFDFLNAPGGICNGITSGLEDEEGIEFVGPAEGGNSKGGVTDNWRWAEQWLPHASWYLLALSARIAAEGKAGAGSYGAGA